MAIVQTETLVAGNVRRTQTRQMDVPCLALPCLLHLRKSDLLVTCSSKEYNTDHALAPDHLAPSS